MTHNSEATPATALTTDEVDRLQSALPIETYQQVFSLGSDDEQAVAFLKMKTALKSDPDLLAIVQRLLTGSPARYSPWIELQKAVNEVTGEIA